MGGALIQGLLQSGLYQSHQVIVGEANADRRAELQQLYGVQVTTDNRLVVETADVVLLAVKPQVIDGLLREVHGCWRSQQLILSVAAGITLEHLESLLPAGQPVIRVMPNTPCLVGAGVAALSTGSWATAEHLNQGLTLLGAVGTSLVVPEAMMDAVTALSGSGPGYIFLLIETLIDAGVASGLPRAVARQLVLGTIEGSAKMVRTSGKHPAELRDMVTSPGGTTMAGLQAMEEGGLRAACFRGVAAALERARAMH